MSDELERKAGLAGPEPGEKAKARSGRGEIDRLLEDALALPGRLLGPPPLERLSASAPEPSLPLPPALPDAGPFELPPIPGEESGGGPFGADERAAALPETLAAALEAVETELEDEAAASAPAAKPAPERERRRSYVVFGLGGARYAVQATNVVEVGRVPRVTPLPNVPAWLRGVANLRGDILSVVDLRELLGMGPREDGAPGRMLVVCDREETTTALVVDEIPGMTRIAPEAMDPTAVAADERLRPWVAGLVEQEGKLLTVLDVDRLLGAQALRQFQET